MYIASNEIKKIHASSGLKNLRFSKYFDDVTRVWSYLQKSTGKVDSSLLNCSFTPFYAGVLQ